ncbi:hypothetical protein [Kitasatospora sp. NPDC057223]|uniref:hypothetical protein n=1 Tax=Kitasatospora sp. NPDC057223 TaxID=3346055 RepID=UPI0036418D5A
MRAAYLLDPAGRSPQWLGALADAGLDTVVTKAAAVTPGFAAAARAAGLRVVGSVPCFRAGDGPSARYADELRPVDDEGRTWRRMEWYDGLIPTHHAHNRALVRHCAELAASPDLDGLALDFLRWPLHWELELRPGALPRAGSYDPLTLAGFEQHTGLRLPDRGDAPAAARWIDDHHRPEWHDYRAAVITGAAAAVTAAVRAVRPGLWLGAFLVPAPEEQRRALLGQDTAALGRLFDALLVMSYHAILHRPPGFPAEAAAEAREHTGRPVVPMVQVTSDPVHARGADWGPPVGAAQYAAALRGSLRAGRGECCLFPGEGLDEELLRLTRRQFADPVAAEPEKEDHHG